ncbi:MAG: DUF3089 domain-containing protein [Leptospira sp.]|nr:DUF3089 domain-containing protein [Leptospira sp.]
MHKNAFPFLNPGFIFILIQISCLWIIRPNGNFKDHDPPPVPDYSKPEYWAALPGKIDPADSIVENSTLRDNQADAPCDVFFIHPTTFLAGKTWNAAALDDRVNERTDNGTIKFQASAFNGSCKVYAPRYRQAILYGVITKGENRDRSMGLAYSDVRKSFLYYLENWNKGRPFFIASHSQGSRHAIGILTGFFDNQILLKKLVAAYIVGTPLLKNTYQKIPVCSSPVETNCVISWNTFEWNTRIKRETENFSNSVCVNPLNWKTDGEYAPFYKNLGGVRNNFQTLDPGVTDAQCENGVLRVHSPVFKGYPDILNGDFHVLDYNLFYLNIRKNVQDRLEAYLKKS